MQACASDAEVSSLSAQVGSFTEQVCALTVDRDSLRRQLADVGAQTSNLRAILTRPMDAVEDEEETEQARARVSRVVGEAGQQMHELRALHLGISGASGHLAEVSNGRGAQRVRSLLCGETIDCFQPAATVGAAVPTGARLWKSTRQTAWLAVNLRAG